MAASRTTASVNGASALLLHCTTPQGNMLPNWKKGTFHFAETQRQTHSSLGGLPIYSGLGIPQGPPGGAGECEWAEGCLGLLL
ncbi:hypothetical protein AMECASPLE_010568 [Ameca splendens]|uniref:Uncharacterized protein n=1 Tax=Ameca splendens TaxID=208324 RepID=A0ABV0Y0G7_9TELE